MKKDPLGLSIEVVRQAFASPFAASIAGLPAGAEIKPEAASVAASGAQGVLVSSYFKLVFLTVLGVLVVMLGIEIALVLFVAEPTANQQAVISGVDSVWKGAAGAILGLLGGKVT